MWYHVALFLYQKWVSANVASIASLFFIIPIFWAIHVYIELGILYWMVIFLAINMKLILNAIDGIIAEKEQVFTQLWRYLNVGTDIFPDMFILFLIFSKIGVEYLYILILCCLVWLYGLWEFLYIYLYKKQNLFFGKELRVSFYLIIFFMYVWAMNMIGALLIYFIFFVVHNVRFFYK